MNPVQESNRRPRRLTQREDAHLKLLDSLKHGSGSELGVVRQIAAWIDSPVVLSRICGHSPWYDQWDIKEALVRNDHTPDRFRGDLEAKVAIFELLRELDNPSLQPREKVEIRDNIKHLTETLSGHDREVVKKRAYDFSASRRGKTGAAVTLPETEQPKGEDAEDGFRLDFEPTTDVPEPEPDSQTVSPEADWEGGTPDRTQDEAGTESEIAVAAEAAEAEPDVAEPREFASVDDALAKFDLDWEQDTLSDETEPVTAEPAETASGDGEAESPAAEANLEFSWEFPEVPAAERPSVGDRQPSADDAQETALVEPEPAPEIEHEIQPQTEGGGDLPQEILATGEAYPDEVTRARESSDTEVLGRLVHGSEEVQIALLDNPALDDRLSVMLARKAGGRLATEIYRRRHLFMRPAVRLAFLETPHAPAAALLEIVNTLGDVAGLVKVVRNPKIRFMEVKAKARARLSTVFKSMGTGEKLAAIRKSGRFLLKELWTDFFRDEALVLQCLREKSLDQGIVLEISRSRIAPRYALELIAKTPAWIANQNICMALVQNPKTPRDAVPRLIQKLSPANRRAIRNNARLPANLRRYA